MSHAKLLALYHFCNNYHSGQFSRLYRLSCIVRKHFTPSRFEEYFNILYAPDDCYEEASAFYRIMVQNYEAGKYSFNI